MSVKRLERIIDRRLKGLGGSAKRVGAAAARVTRRLKWIRPTSQERWLAYAPKFRFQAEVAKSRPDSKTGKYLYLAEAHAGSPENSRAVLTKFAPTAKLAMALVEKEYAKLHAMKSWLLGYP